MKKKEIQEEVMRILRKLVDDERVCCVNLGSVLDVDLGLDGLDVTLMAAELSKKFFVEIPDEEADYLATQSVSRLFDYLTDRVVG